MAEFEGRLSITGADEVERRLAQIERQMRDLADAEGEASESSDELSESTEGTSESMGGLKASTVAAAAAVAAIAAGIKEAAQTAAEFAREFERQSGVLNRFSGSIDKASDRVNSLISDIDLMVASNSAARGNLELSEEQFADLAVAATEMAAATGEDATEALNDLIDALKGGSPDELMEKFGVKMGEVTDKSKAQEIALAQLSEKYGDMESSADTLAGKLDTLGTKIDNVETEAIQAITAQDKLARSFSDLFDEIDELTGHMQGEDTNPFSLMEEGIIVVSGGMTTVIERWTRVIASVQKASEAAQALIDRDWDRFTQKAGEARDLFPDMATFSQHLADNMNAAADAIARAKSEGPVPEPDEDEDEDPAGGTRKKPGEPVGAEEVDLDQLARQLEDENAIADARERQLDALEIANRWHARNVREVERQKAAAQEFKAELSDTSRKAMDLARMFEQMAEEQRNQQEEQREEQQRTMESGVKSGMDVITGLGKAIASSQEDALQEWLKAQAKRWGFKALEETALGIATLIMNPPEASTHFIAAGMFGGLAAAAGAGSAAAGGGASKGGAAGSQAGTAPESSPGGGRDRGGGTTIVNVNSPVPEVELGRTTARAMRAANRVRAA